MFCVDLDHSFTVPSHWEANAVNATTPLTGYSGNTYGQIPSGTGKLVNNAGEIAYLVNHYSASVVGNDASAAALQAAIWQLEYGSNFSYSGALTGQINTYLSAANGQNEDATFFDPKSNTNMSAPYNIPQAFVTGGVSFGPVPEPSTLVLWGSVLIGLAGARRIRRGSSL
jgi:hypothetical protein